MKVSFSHNEITKGLFSKTTFIEVVTDIQLSAEEVAIVNRRKLSKVIVMEREADALVRYNLKNDVGRLAIANAGNASNLMIGHLMGGRPDSYHFSTPIAAKNYETELTKNLKETKDYIMGSEELSESKTIEF